MIKVVEFLSMADFHIQMYTSSNNLLIPFKNVWLRALKIEQIINKYTFLEMNEIYYVIDKKVFS